MLNNNYIKDEYHNSHAILTAQPGRGSLLLGDFNSVSDKQLLETHAVKTIITAAQGMSHLKIDPTIKHITYPLLDAKSEKISVFFNDSFNLIDQNLKRGGVLVHCAAGISRSATLVIAYLMKKNKWTFKEAISFVKKIRPSVCPNLGFEMQLKDYEKQLVQSKLKVDLTRTVLPLRQNIFTILSEPNQIGKQNNLERGSFPHINPLNKTHLRSKLGGGRNLSRGDHPRSQQIQGQTPNSNNNQSLKKNLMINTLPANYYNINLLNNPNNPIGRQHSYQNSNMSSSHKEKKDDASRKLAKLMFSSNMYKWSSYNKVYEQHMMRLTSNIKQNGLQILMMQNQMQSPQRQSQSPQINLKKKW